MPKPALSSPPHLKVALDPEVQAMRDHIEGLELTVRKQAWEIGRLTREMRENAEQDDLFPIAQRLFAYHCRVSGHTRAEFSPERFRMVKRRLKKKDGLEACLRVIAGVLADDWKVKHKKTLWEHCFGSEKAWEEGLANCPADFRMPEGAA